MNAPETILCAGLDYQAVFAGSPYESAGSWEQCVRLQGFLDRLLVPRPDGRPHRALVWGRMAGAWYLRAVFRRYPVEVAGWLDRWPPAGGLDHEGLPVWTPQDLPAGLDWDWLFLSMAPAHYREVLAGLPPALRARPVVLLYDWEGATTASTVPVSGASTAPDAPTSGPPVVLATHGGSGTRWLARMLARALSPLGYAEGTADYEYRGAAPRPGRWYVGHYTVAQVEAMRAGMPPGAPLKVLYLYRDLRDALVSVWRTFRDGGAAHTRPLRRYFRSLPPEESLRLMIQGFDERHGDDRVLWNSAGQSAAEVVAWRRYAAAAPREVLTLTYEDLLADAAGRLRAVVDFLGVAPPAGALRAAVEENAFERLSGGRKPGQAPPEGAVLRNEARKAQVGGWADHLTGELKALFKAQAGVALVELGYERDLDW